MTIHVITPSAKSAAAMSGSSASGMPPKIFLIKRVEQHDLVGHFSGLRQRPAIFRKGVCQRQQQCHQRIGRDKQPQIRIDLQLQRKAERARRRDRGGKAQRRDTAPVEKFFQLWIIIPQHHAGQEERKVLYGPADLEDLRQKRKPFYGADGRERTGGDHADDRFSRSSLFILFPEKRRDQKHEEDRVGKPVGAADDECIAKLAADRVRVREVPDDHSAEKYLQKREKPERDEDTEHLFLVVRAQRLPVAQKAGDREKEWHMHMIDQVLCDPGEERQRLPGGVIGKAVAQHDKKRRKRFQIVQIGTCPFIKVHGAPPLLRYRLDSHL